MPKIVGFLNDPVVNLLIASTQSIAFPSKVHLLSANSNSSTSLALQAFGQATSQAHPEKPPSAMLFRKNTAAPLIPIQSFVLLDSVVLQ